MINSDRTIYESGETIPTLTLARSENRYQLASIFFLCLIMAVFWMSFGIVNAQSEDSQETTKAEVPLEKFASTRVELLPMRWMMGTGGILEQQKYEEAQEKLTSCPINQPSSQCQNDCQLVKKVERVWNAVVQNCRCETVEHPLNHPCKSTCEGIPPSGVLSEADADVPITFCARTPPKYEVNFTGLVFATYVFLDMLEGMKQAGMLIQGINQMMAAMQVDQNAIIQIEKELYLHTRKCVEEKLEDSQCPWKDMDEEKAKNEKEANKLWLTKVDQVISTLVCQEPSSKSVAGCEQTPPKPDIDKLIKECQDNPQACKINPANVFATYVGLEGLDGLTLIEHLNGIFGHLGSVAGHLNDISSGFQKVMDSMAASMILMNRNMEMMRHDMGIMRRDMDSTLGRAGRMMPWGGW